MENETGFSKVSGRYQAKMRRAETSEPSDYTRINYSGFTVSALIDILEEKEMYSGYSWKNHLKIPRPLAMQKGVKPETAET